MASTTTGKNGLKVRDVAKDHFSSGVKINEPKFSRLVVRFLEGKSLLASDIQTGKSDPVCFVWCGPVDESPELENFLDESSGITLTSVCPTTCDPIWNEDVTFRLDVTDLTELIHLKCSIYCRDEDIINDVTSYDDLGMVEVPLKEVISKGRACANSIVLSGNWYRLNKSPGMRKVDGSLKLTISIIFGTDDADAIAKQLESNELLRNASNNPISRQSQSQMGSTAMQCQNLLKYTIDPSLARPNNNNNSSSVSLSDAGSRAGSPFGRVSSARLRSSRTRPASASRSISSSSRTFNAADDSSQSLDGGSINSISSSSFVPTAKRPTSAPPRQRIGRRQRGERNKFNTSPTVPIREGSTELDDQSNFDAAAATDDDDAAANGFETVELHVISNDAFDRAAAAGDDDMDGDELGAEMNVLNQFTTPQSSNNTAPTAASNAGQLHINLSHVPIDSSSNEHDHSNNNNGGGDTDDNTAGDSKAQRRGSVTASASASTDGLRIEIEGKDIAELLAEAGVAGPTGDECGLLEDFVSIGLDVVKDRLGDLNVARFGDSVGAASTSAAQKLAMTAKLLARHGSEAGKDLQQQLPSISSKLGNALQAGKQAASSLGGKFNANVAVPSVNMGHEAMMQTATAQAVISDTFEKTGAGVVDRANEVVEGSESTAQAVGDIGDAANQAQVRQLIASSSQQLFAAPAAGDMLFDDFTQGGTEQRNEPESAPEPVSKTNSITQQHQKQQQQQQQQQQQEEQQAVGQGTATAVVRALKEMSDQRKLMQQSLQEIAKATQSGFSKLVNRMNHIEQSMHGRTAAAGGGNSSVGERGIDYNDMFGDEDDDDDVDIENNNSSSNNYRSDRDYNSKRQHEKPRPSQTHPSRRSRNSNSSGGNRKRESSADRDRNSKSGRHSTAPARSSSRSRSPDRNDRSGSSRGSNKRYGSSDMIRKAKAAAAAARTAAAASDAESSQPPLLPLAAVGGSSNSSSGFNTDVQLVMKGADGSRVATTIASSPDNHQQQQQSQQLLLSPPRGDFTPSSEEARNTQFNRHIPALPGSPAPHYNSNYSSSSNNNNNNYPYQQQQQQQQALQYSSPVGHGSSSSGYYLPSSSGRINYAMNKDFADILERGTLEEVGSLLENSAPKPEELSASVRNRLFDAVSTLLLQRQHVERCLIWVLALTRSGQLQQQLPLHSQRDLREALEAAASEPSKRGLLASLLKSQVNNGINRK